MGGCQLFLVRYGKLLQMDEEKYKKIFDEFHDFKSLDDSEMDLNEAVLTTYDDGSVVYGIDTIWYLLQTLKSPAGNNYRFRTLFEVAVLVLITPHSNAGIEIVYSLVNKNQPEGSERNRLAIFYEQQMSTFLFSFFFFIRITYYNQHH